MRPGAVLFHLERDLVAANREKALTMAGDTFAGFNQHARDVPVGSAGLQRKRQDRFRQSGEKPRVGAPPPIDGSGFLQLSFLLAWRVGVSGTAGTLTNIHASSTEIAMLRPGARSGAIA
ncbi:MAG: hypothetical protein DMG70_00130 [Acidobacteria bacterium]|nr:MAG: hypothetical protein DMG70_00130 [Acidobacteriota bacterium]